MAEYNEFPNIMKRLSVLSRRVRDQETAPRLYSAGIGSGGIRIHSGGSLSVRDGGDINILEGGDISIGSGGSVNILNSGQILSEGAAKFSGSANLRGKATIDGNLSILGNVSFPDGKLDGAFLKNQFETKEISVKNATFTTKFTGEKKVISRRLSVPSWANRAYGIMSGSYHIPEDLFSRLGGPVVRVFMDTQKSSGSMAMSYDVSGLTNSATNGTVNAIKTVDVSSKSYIDVGTIAQVSMRPTANGTASFHGSFVFVR